VLDRNLSPDSAVIDAKLVVLQFNAAINARDLDALVALMTEDHRFVDKAEKVVQGREEATAAWRGFFSAFPDYRNFFSLVAGSENHIGVLGRSECSHAALRGPAIWTAVVEDARVQEWRVRHDTPEARATLFADLFGPKA
jgi:hypothetical protein